MTRVYSAGLGKHVRLGRNRPKARPKAVHLGQYLDFQKLKDNPPPDSFDWTPKALTAIKRMYLNDQEGDCVIASKYHQLGVWSANESGADATILASDQEVQSAYHGICGPGDNGCNITDVLDVFKARGLTASGKVYKIDDYIAIDWTNKLEVIAATLLFGGGCLGINLPAAWTQGGDGSVWDVTNSRIVGGHDVPFVGYNAQGATILTWGGTRLITWPAFLSRNWLEEAYALLSPNWYAVASKSPYGIAADDLKADLAKLGGGTIPPLGPPTPPPPPPPPGGNVLILNSGIARGAHPLADNAADEVYAAVDMPAGTYQLVPVPTPPPPPPPPPPPSPPGKLPQVIVDDVNKLAADVAAIGK